jgi:enoyl-CoA hydratase/carnithine racemase
MATELEREVVRADEDGGVFRITLARPPANALGAPLVEGLEAALDALEDSQATVVVVSSDIRGLFAAGADIKQMIGLSVPEFVRYRDAVRSPLERLASCGRPSIAAIDGLALGGGLELAMACSLRFATPDARLGLPEVKLGLIPGAGGTQRLPRLVGRGRALDILLTGREVTGTEAARIGLVDRLVEGDVTAEALAFAAKLARLPASAVEAIITCVDAAETLSDSGMAVEGDAVVRMFEHGDARDGLAAFLESRTGG